MKTIGIIPARYGSTRLEGKPLALIDGISMIERVYKQCMKAQLLDFLIVATDDIRIENHIKSFGGNVMMTSTKHDSGTERCAETIKNLKKNTNLNFDIVINIQGDEPLINPQQIDDLIEVFKNESVNIATQKIKINSNEELFDSNVVKVISDNNNFAIYFSRTAIPYFRNEEKEKWILNTNYYKHIGIYGYKTDTLLKIVNQPKSNLENCESLEQLRWLENGCKIFVKDTKYECYSIDNYNDIIKIENLIKNKKMIL